MRYITQTTTAVRQSVSYSFHEGGGAVALFFVTTFSDLLAGDECVLAREHVSRGAFSKDRDGWIHVKRSRVKLEQSNEKTTQNGFRDSVLV